MAQLERALAQEREAARSLRAQLAGVTDAAEGDRESAVHAQRALAQVRRRHCHCGTSFGKLQQGLWRYQGRLAGSWNEGMRAWRGCLSHACRPFA